MATALARKFRVDCTGDITLATGWTEIKAVTDFQPDLSPHLEDATAYDTNGQQSYEKTIEQWTAQVTFMRRTTAGVYDPGQQILLNKAVGQWGDAARVGLRWYDRNGGPEAYQGIAFLDWKRAQTGVKQLDAAQVTFTGTDQPATLIAVNPITATQVPVVTAVTPTGAAAGAQITIVGTGFTGVNGATGVKIGGVNATSYVVVSDITIVAVVPAGSAGSAPVIVTNGAGASTAYAYTRA